MLSNCRTRQCRVVRKHIYGSISMPHLLWIFAAEGHAEASFYLILKGAGTPVSLKLGRLRLRVPRQRALHGKGVQPEGLHSETLASGTVVCPAAWRLINYMARHVCYCERKLCAQVVVEKEKAQPPKRHPGPVLEPMQINDALPRKHVAALTSDVDATKP